MKMKEKYRLEIQQRQNPKQYKTEMASGQPKIKRLIPA